MRHLNTPIYAFFKPMPAIDHIDGHHVHIFSCSAKVCQGKGRHGWQVQHFLNTADATLTSNLRWHAKTCWGDETVAAAVRVKDVYSACCYVFTLFEPHHKQHYYRTASFLYLDPTSPRWLYLRSGGVTIYDTRTCFTVLFHRWSKDHYHCTITSVSCTIRSIHKHLLVVRFTST